MRSKTSFFDPTLSRNLLKRFWPLWLAYLVLLIALLPANLLSLSNNEWALKDMNRYVLQGGVDMVKVSAWAVVPIIMAMFSHLYNKRDCGLINSLPLRRETTFWTCYLTGLVPMLLCSLLCWAVTVLMCAANGNISPEYIHMALLMNALSIIGFSGLAVLCATLTGSILILPALYYVLNYVAFVVLGLLESILSSIVYGFYELPDGLFFWLSPFANIQKYLDVLSAKDALGLVIPGRYTVDGMEILWVYAAAGIALLLASLFIYKQRHMECAGDVVAVKCLRPVFKICAAAGTALLLSFIIMESLLQNRLGGFNKALVYILLLALGALLGYYAAEMLLQKSLRVFRCKPLGALAVWLLLSAGLLSAELDAFGFERRLPAPEDILSVNLYSDTVELPQLFDDYLLLHENILANKEHNDLIEEGRYVYLSYALKDGSRLSRKYLLDLNKDWLQDPRSSLSMYRALHSIPQVKELLHSPRLPVSPETISFGCINIAEKIDGQNLRHRDIAITDQEALDFYQNCVLPDLKDSSLGTIFVYEDSLSRSLESNINFYLDLKSPEIKADDYSDPMKYHSFSLNITTDAKRCIRWLEENKDLELLSQAELYPQQENDIPVATEAAVAYITK